MTREEPAHQTATLERTLGLRDLILLIIGTVIGSGIFIVPGAVLRQVQGGIGLAMLVWLVGGILSLLGALTYGELAAMNPKAGGIYIYIRDCFSPLPAFLYGWTLFFVISSGSIATLAVAFSAYLGELVPLTPALGKLTAVGMIVVVTAVNVLGTRQSSDLENWTTAIKVAAILIMSVVLLWLGRGFSGPGITLWPTEGGATQASGLGIAMIGVLWAYEGWQYVFKKLPTFDYRIMNNKVTARLVAATKRNDPRRGPHAGSPRGVLGNSTKRHQEQFVLVRVISWIVVSVKLCSRMRRSRTCA